VKRWLGALGATGLLAVVLHPFFFVIYRLMVFNTTPRDEYWPYMLWLLGEPGGKLHESPYVYRPLSALAAAPFYYLLPTISLANIPPSIPVTELRGIAAIAALSFVAAIAASVVAYRIAIDKAGLGRIEGAIAGTLMFIFFWHSAVHGIDSVAMLALAIAVYLLDRPFWFAAWAFVSIVINEKIAMVLVIWLTVRCVLVADDRRRLAGQWIAAVIAFGLYLAMVKIVHVPGNEYQMTPSGYLANVLTNLSVLPTARGLLLNVLPTLILLGLTAWSWRQLPRNIGGGLFRPIDMLVIIGLCAITLVLTQEFQIGRIVMHAAALFVVPIGASLGLWLRKQPVHC
jgi:hypothetical protein